MWDRKELKSRGRFALHNNYWKCVFVALLLALFVYGGAGVSATAAGGRVPQAPVGTPGVPSVEGATTGTPDFSQIRDAEDLISLLQSVGIVLSTEDQQTIIQFGDALESMQRDMNLDEIIPGGAMIVLLTVVLTLVVILVVVAIVKLVTALLRIFLLNPLEVGCQAFFVNNAQGVGELGDLGRGFSPGYGRVIGTMFLREFYIFLWSLLFIIPGIIKKYSYRMVPYILADQPEMGGNDAITLSRRMMDGNKWRAFVLDLSFIGWGILSALTLGILGLFYVRPYRCCTNAELYQALREQ